MKTIFSVFIILLACSYHCSAQFLPTPKFKKGKWGLVVGVQKVTDYKYDKIKLNTSTYDQFFVKLEDRWGLLDIRGNELIPPLYESIEYHFNDFFIVGNNNKVGLVDVQNNLLIPIQYDEIDPYVFEDGAALVKLNEEWFYVNDKGEKVERKEEELSLPNNGILPLFDPSCRELGDKELIVRCSEKKMFNFMADHIRYPRKAKRRGIQGLVVISFIISPEGEMLEPTISRDIGGGCGEEGLRVVKMMGDWYPAEVDGEKVASPYYLPIRFTLEK